MTDSPPVRGPDFLPYPFPVLAATAPTAVAPPPTGGRWRRALDGVTGSGVAAITAGIAALLSLLVVSLLAGHRGTGATLASLAAVVAVGAGGRALTQDQPPDSRNLVKAGMATGVASALVALLLLAGRSAVAEQPPVQVPVPTPTSSSAPQPQRPTPSPGSPAPRTSPGVVLPPGADLFGIPSRPDPPATLSNTATGTLTGKVVTPSGAALPGATVVVTRADPTDTSDAPGCSLRVTTTTGADGRYTLQLCQLGNLLGYTVTISADGAQASADLYVNAGRATVYNVVLAVRRA